MISIAIDGPSGAGKSSLAKSLASHFGYVYLDTGALYRAIGYFAVQQIGDIYHVDPIEIISLLDHLSLEVVHTDSIQHVLVNGTDVSNEIRTQQIASAASYVSAIPAVRAYLLHKQREFAEKENVVMDGRDVGTVILPDASVKIFLTASPEERTHRRCNELVARGMVCDYRTVLAEINQRDLNDSSRKIAPLKIAEDAIVLDNSGCEEKETFLRAVDIVRSKLSCCTK